MIFEDPLMIENDQLKKETTEGSSIATLGIQ